MFAFLAITFACLALSLGSVEPVDLEERAQTFVLETKRVVIPGHPFAFNPSLIRWKGELLLSFRTIPDRKQSFHSLLWLIRLNEQMEPSGEASLLNTRPLYYPVPSRAEDGRLIAVGEQLYFVYADNSEEKVSRGGFRVHLAEVKEKGGRFYLEGVEPLLDFPGASREFREKNWVPFVYNQTLLLSYSLDPHRVFLPLIGTGSCVEIASSVADLGWDWGVLRGGTTALFLEEEGEYLSFFHSSVDLGTVHSGGKKMSHYFMGAYTFQKDPPFAITRISPEPIVAKGFYSGESYKPYWKPVRCVFPCGHIVEGDHIWISYGRQDHECWLVKLDKTALLESLRSIR